MVPLSSSSNTALSALSRTIASALAWQPAQLVPGPLPRGDSRDFVYFPCSGLVSLRGSEEGGPEVAVVGRTGSTGLALDTLDAWVVLPGTAWRVPRISLREMACSAAAVGEVMWADNDRLVRQMLQHLCAATRQSIDQRVARWLLAAEQHSGSDSFRITHDILAAFLAVRRSSVTVALQELEGKGAVRCRRSRILIRDRAALGTAAFGERLTRKASTVASSPVVVVPDVLAD